MQIVKQELLALLNMNDYEFIYQLPADDKHIRIDSTRIVMALTNLMHNAISFTPRGGKITLSAQLASKHEMHISVKDSGKGIAPDQIEAIFGEFYQVEDHMIRKHGGLGIGLSIARAIVNAHSGRIWADSEGLGKGATFTMALPTAE